MAATEPAAPQAIADLVEQARGGSAGAWASLHRRFAPMVHGLLLSRHPVAVADELTQECFVAAFRRLAQLREPEKFGGWLAAIARRLDGGELQRRQSLDTVAEPVDPASGPERQAEAQAILDAIRRLPPAYREPLVLRLVEGLSGSEIAAQTGLGEGSVRVNLHRGMQKLRELLDIAPPARRHQDD